METIIKEKRKLKNESGITLVALIITIIILILLSTVVIINLKKINFIDLAMNSTSNYAISQLDEENSIDTVNIKIADAVKQIEKMHNQNNDIPTPELSETLEPSVNPEPSETPEPTKEPEQTPPETMKINLQEAVYSGETEILSITPDAAVLTMGDGWKACYVCIDNVPLEQYSNINITCEFIPGYEYGIGVAGNNYYLQNSKHYGTIHEFLPFDVGGRPKLSKTTLSFELPKGEQYTRISFVVSSLDAVFKIYEIELTK